MVLPTGVVLVAGGHPVEPGWRLLDSAEIFDPVAAAFTSTGSLNYARYGTWLSAGLIAGGMVLVADARVDDASTPEYDELPVPSELYDPRSGTWSVTGSMRTYANGPLVVLPDGDAFVSGGIDWLTERPVRWASRYRAESGKWLDAAPLSGPRVGHLAIAVAGGVLVVGGSPDYPSTDSLATAELYDPDADAWRPVASMAQGRWSARGVALQDGRILVVGGSVGNHIDSGALASAEIFDPRTQSWSITGAMAEARAAFSLTLLSDGRALAAGGYNGGNLASAEIYDPAGGTWSPAPAMTEARRLHTAVALPSGDVLVVGGYRSVQLRTTEIWSCRP